jgi:hypothetical protein
MTFDFLSGIKDDNDKDKSVYLKAKEEAKPLTPRGIRLESGETYVFTMDKEIREHYALASLFWQRKHHNIWEREFTVSYYSEINRQRAPLGFLIHWNDYYGKQGHSRIDFLECTNGRCVKERKRLETIVSEEVRLSGMLQDMSYEEYIKYFNDNEEAFNKLKADLFIAEKPPVHEQNVEELIKNIQTLQKAKNILIVLCNAKAKKLKDLEDNATEAERKKIKEFDKQYKPKVYPDGVEKKEPSPKEKRVTQSKEDKMIATLKTLGFSDEDIEKELIKRGVKK